MSSGRYGGSAGDNSSTDVELAEIRSELRSQGGNIAKLAGKIDVMAESVTSMSVQVQHLVTKESCAEGRAALASELKQRMESGREITGIGVPVKDLVKHWSSSKLRPSLTPLTCENSRVDQSAVSTDQHTQENSKWSVSSGIGLI
jgi:hypothetical protein